MGDSRTKVISLLAWLPLCALHGQTMAGCRVLAISEKSFSDATCPGLFQKWEEAPPSGIFYQLSQVGQTTDFFF